MSISEIKKIFKTSFYSAYQNPKFWFLGFFLIFFVNNEINIITATLGQITIYLSELMNNIKAPVIVQSKEISNIFVLIYDGFQKINLFNISILITIILFLYLIIISQIIVIILAKYFNQSSKKIKLSFKEFFLKSHRFLKSTIIIYLLLGGIVFIFLNIPILFKNYLFSNTLPSLFTISYIIIVLSLSLIFTFIAKFSLFFIIIKKEKIFLSIQKSTKFFFKNWLSIIKIFLFLLATTILFGLIIFLIYIGILVPVSLFLRLILLLTSPSFFLTIITILAFFILIIFLFLLFFFSYFQSLVWPLFFIRNISYYSKKLKLR